jgi:hypothetical protein
MKTESTISFTDSKGRVQGNVVPNFISKKDVFLDPYIENLKTSHTKIITNGGWKF